MSPAPSKMAFSLKCGRLESTCFGKAPRGSTRSFKSFSRRKLASVPFQWWQESFSTKATQFGRVSCICASTSWSPSLRLPSTWPHLVSTTAQQVKLLRHLSQIWQQSHRSTTAHLSKKNILTCAVLFRVSLISWWSWQGWLLSLSRSTRRRVFSNVIQTTSCAWSRCLLPSHFWSAPTSTSVDCLIWGWSELSLFVHLFSTSSASRGCTARKICRLTWSSQWGDQSWSFGWCCGLWFLWFSSELLLGGSRCHRDWSLIRLLTSFLDGFRSSCASSLLPWLPCMKYQSKSITTCATWSKSRLDRPKTGDLLILSCVMRGNNGSQFVMTQVNETSL